MRLQSVCFLRRTRWLIARTCAVAAVSFSFCQTQAAAGSLFETYTANAIGTEATPGSTPTGGNVVTTSDITGTIFAAGNVGAGNSFTVGQDLPSSFPATSIAVTTLGTASNFNLDRGSVLAASTGDVTGVSYNGGSGAGAVAAGTGVLSSTAQALYSQVNYASTYFTGLTTTAPSGSYTTGANSSISANSGTYTLSYSGPAGGIASYSLNASLLTGSNNIDLTAITSGAGTVVINVSGATSGFNFNNTNFEGDLDGTDASKIVWNFGTTTGDLLTSREVYGSILAPDMVLENGNAIDGSVWVQSIHAGGEIHYKDNGTIVQYSGFDPNTVAVPEPSTIVLAGMGIFFGGLYQWTRKRYGLIRKLA